MERRQKRENIPLKELNRSCLGVVQKTQILGCLGGKKHNHHHHYVQY